MGGTQQYWLPENTAYQQLMAWLKKERLNIVLDLDDLASVAMIAQLCSQKQLSRLSQLVAAVEKELGRSDQFSNKLRVLLD